MLSPVHQALPHAARHAEAQSAFFRPLCPCLRVTLPCLCLPSPRCLRRVPLRQAMAADGTGAGAGAAAPADSRYHGTGGSGAAAAGGRSVNRLYVDFQVLSETGAGRCVQKWAAQGRGLALSCACPQTAAFGCDLAPFMEVFRNYLPIMDASTSFPHSAPSSEGSTATHRLQYAAV